ncbi:Cleavage polyadenylation factor subunit clp1 [Basidiobolus ranarum]|uniref:Polynucleotide 5'-hydroxyl-kinase GRC3 n=1 Tax=Basidiobolus ranarum TaxID=34480 RepID=A0ABR2WWN7_9FUNG
MNQSQKVNPKNWKLDPEHEFRFEVDYKEKITIKLTSGTAEIFGTELIVGREYEFSGKKLALFTWHGCTFELVGKCSVEYVANETPMINYLNTHLALENLRERAEATNSDGPRIMIIGPTDAGKTSLARILLNYALKRGRESIYVDIDPEEGSITMPGTISATSINQMIDAEEGFGYSATNVPGMGTFTMPLVYYYGYSNPAENPKLYNLLVNQLADTVKARIKEDSDARASGIIIDTNGLINNVGHDVIQNAINAFSVNVLLVVGQERLYSEMVRANANNSNMTILKLSKSGGVVNRDVAFRRLDQMEKIREYFYGTAKMELSPYSTLVNFEDITIYRVGEDSLAPSSALPIGIDRKVSETQLVSVKAGDILFHSILAVINSESSNESDLLRSNIAGFIYISEVEDAKSKMTILSPCPGKLPKNNLLMGNFKWVET